MNESDNMFEEEYLTCERRHIFFVLMGVAGFFGAFTYSIRGGIFCNAQTANFVLFAMALGNAQWKHALYFLIPMSAYFLGAVISEALPGSIKKLQVNMANIRKKLGSRPGSNAYILNELGVGYRMIDEDARSGEINE